MNREQEANDATANAANTTDPAQGAASAGVGKMDTATDGQQEMGRARNANEYVSTAPAASMLDGQIKPGVMVSDAGGETIGNVLEYDEQGGRVVVRKGWLFNHDTEFPLDAIGDKGANGIFLKQTIDELRQQYSDRLNSDATAAPTNRAGSTGGGAADTSAIGSAPAQMAGDAGTTRTTEMVQPAQGEMVQPAQESVSDRAWQPGQGSGAGTTDIRIPVYEEQLVAGTREEERGRVHLHKEVTAEQESIPVTLRREQVTVERVPVDQNNMDPNAVTDAFKNANIDVPVMGEEVVAGKQVLEVEEVRLHKDAMQTQEQVTDTVRKERVVIDGGGTQNKGDMTMRDRDTMSTDTTR